MKVKKTIKTLLPFFWMAVIYLLSDRPEVFYPEKFFNYSYPGHVFLYAVLALLIAFTFFEYENSWPAKKILFFSAGASFLYALTDEYHQLFVPGRTASLSDLAADFLGASLAAGFFYLWMNGRCPRLLLHVCCVGCGARVAEELGKEYRVVMYFYNPSIFPAGEYERRLAEAGRVAREAGFKLIKSRYDHGTWLNKIKGREADPERGERCLICYQDRLEETGREASRRGYSFFATTLTVSPHKDASAINRLGKEIALRFGLKFLDQDFKKDGGWQKACLLSKQLNLYRQNYCGCEFSRNRNYRNS